VVPVEWQTPKFAWVDPYKDALAEFLALRAGTRSYQDVIGEHGRDWKDVIAEIKAWNDLLDKTESRSTAIRAHQHEGRDAEADGAAGSQRHNRFRRAAGTECQRRPRQRGAVFRPRVNTMKRSFSWRAAAQIRAAEIRVELRREGRQQHRGVLDHGRDGAPASWIDGPYDEELIVDAAIGAPRPAQRRRAVLNTHNDYDLSDVHRLRRARHGPHREWARAWRASSFPRRGRDGRGAEDPRGAHPQQSVGYSYPSVEKTEPMTAGAGLARDRLGADGDLGGADPGRSPARRCAHVRSARAMPFELQFRSATPSRPRARMRMRTRRAGLIRA
jgi:hypothetical protein